MMTDMENMIAGEIGRINALLEANGQGHQKPRYSNSETFTFAISSPVILRFASILVRFDEMYNRLDTAWLCGLVDSTKAQEFRRENCTGSSASFASCRAFPPAPSNAAARQSSISRCSTAWSRRAKTTPRIWMLTKTLRPMASTLEVPPAPSIRKMQKSANQQ